MLKTLLAAGASTTAPPSVTSQVAAWWADDLGVADGGSVSSWTSRSGTKTVSAGSAPTMRTTGLGGRPAVEFNGTSNYLTLASALTSAFQGVVLAVCSITTPSAGQVIWAPSYTHVTNKYVIGTTSYMGSGAQVEIQQANGDAADAVRGSTAVPAATLALLEWSSSGTAYAHRLNNATQTMSVIAGANTGDWFGDVSSVDNFTIGALRYNNKVVGFCAMKLAYLLVADAELSSGDRAALKAWITSYYGLALS